MSKQPDTSHAARPPSRLGLIGDVPNVVRPTPMRRKVDWDD